MQLCVSDNYSTDDTYAVVETAAQDIRIKYRRNSGNLGLARNILSVVEMAEGEFVWMIGDDDLVMPGAIDQIVELIKQFPDVDYFYLNANHLTTDFVRKFPQPFELHNLPNQMLKFSSFEKSGTLPFFSLINPAISFDFLGGIFLSAFRRSMWVSHVGVLDGDAILDSRIYSHFDNTFPHIKIFAKAFASSTAYFSARAASVCLAGAREWVPMYPLVRSVRIVEALDEYKRHGLRLFPYVTCKNSALSYFLPDVVKMFLHKKESGYSYINFKKLFWSNCLYPNFYLSLLYPLFRKSVWGRLGSLCKRRFRGMMR